MNQMNSSIGYLLFAGALSLPIPGVALYQSRVEGIVTNIRDDFSKRRQAELPQGCKMQSTTRISYNRYFQEIECPDGLAINRTLEGNEDGSGKVDESIFQNGVGQEIREYIVDPSGYYTYNSFNFCSKAREQLASPIYAKSVRQLILNRNDCSNL